MHVIRTAAAAVTEALSPSTGKHRRPRRPVEGPEFVEAVERMINALESRVDEDPTLLPRVLDLIERVKEIPNVAAARNMERGEVDRRTGLSSRELAAIMKISQPAVIKRAALGREIIAARHAAAGAADFKSRAAATRKRLDAAAAKAAPALADFIARRSA